MVPTRCLLKSPSPKRGRRTAVTDPTTETDSGDPIDVQPRGMPRWVKVSLLVVVALIVVAVILNLLDVAPGGHGPMRHIPGGDMPASSAPDHGPRMHDR